MAVLRRLSLLGLLLLLGCALDLEGLNEGSGGAGSRAPATTASNGGTGGAPGGPGGGLATGRGGGMDARAPGPHRSEWGQTTWWKVDTVTSGLKTDCTNALGWNFGLNTATAFADKPDITYRVEFGGATAVGTNCSEIGTDCLDTNRLWTIAGHQLHSTVGPAPLYEDKHPDCGYAIDYEWTLNDLGETMVWEVRGTVRADDVKSDCAALEAEHMANAANSFGLVGCKVSYDVYLNFVSIVPPS